MFQCRAVELVGPGFNLKTKSPKSILHEHCRGIVMVNTKEFIPSDLSATVVCNKQTKSRCSKDYHIQMSAKPKLMVDL